MRQLVAVVPKPPDLCKDGRLEGISTEGWIAISIVLGFIAGMLVGILAAWIAFQKQQQRMARNMIPDPVVDEPTLPAHAPATKEKLFSPLRTSVNKLSVADGSIAWQSSFKHTSISSQYPLSPDSLAPPSGPFHPGLQQTGSDSDRAAQLHSSANSSRSDVYPLKDAHLHSSLNHPLSQHVTQPMSQLHSQTVTQPVSQLRRSQTLPEAVGQLRSQIVTQPISQLHSQTVTQPISQLHSQTVTQPVGQLPSQAATQPPSQQLRNLSQHPLLARGISPPASQASSQIGSLNRPLSSNRAQMVTAGPTIIMQPTGGPRPPVATIPPPLTAPEPPLSHVTPTTTAPDYNPFLDPALNSKPAPSPTPPLTQPPPQPPPQQIPVNTAQSKGADLASSSRPPPRLAPEPIPIITPEPILEECESPTMSTVKGFAFPVLDGARESKEQESLGELILSGMDDELQALGQPPMLPLERKKALKLLLAERNSTSDVEMAMHKAIETICRDRMQYER